ncbi:metallophosphoesterase [soil metagenome]
MASPSRYYQHVSTAFAKLRGERGVRERRPVGALRMVIFSDHHRGDRTGSDEFQRCEATYRAALDHYYEAGYQLVLLGDVEELWKTMPGLAVEAYADILASERRFAQAGRYLRLFGNHDDAWGDGALAGRHLGDYICDESGCFLVHEAVTIEVTEDGDGTRRLGDLFLTHGHQGTFYSDRWAGPSRWVVRWLWRPVQRVLQMGLSTPANDYELRLKHELAMHRWAAEHPGVILVAGHTHRPVFCSHSHESHVTSEIAAREQARAAAATDGDREAIGQRIAAHRKELQALLAGSSGKMIDRPDNTRPCYFNTGCCSFADGDITGLEIADGEIRLVKWSAKAATGGGPPQSAPHTLRRAGLRDLFARLD